MNAPLDRGDVRLAVDARGPEGAPVVVLVHGFPDTREVWEGVASRLAERYRVVTYDVRGQGESSAPPAADGYRLAHLADDLRAVARAHGGGRRVHVVGHDWGAIQAWEAITDDGAERLFASYTSISGPCLDHVAHWTRREGASARAAVQGLRSAYVYLFGVPRLGEASVRALLPALAGRLASQGHALAARVAHGDAAARAALVETALRGIPLYRENMLRVLAAPRARRTRVPVQLVVPRRDAYVSTSLAASVEGWADDLVRRDVDGPHWLPVTDPERVARWIAEHVDAHDDEARPGVAASSTSTRGLRRGAFALRGALVVVTGAGSGIGRETAYAFAAEGARVVAADLDEAAAGRTAAWCTHLAGAPARAARVDVSDADAMERFAADVLAREGVPDVVVNNAGVAVAGGLLETPVAEWQRLVGVNVFGVLHGARLFGRAMVERGQGGHVVNVASAAAFTPSAMLSAYATTKAAVLMLSECLRAELAGSGIGVSAICPGIVDTPIATSSRHVGVSDDVDRARRARAARLYRLRGVGPERVAAAILRAVREDAPLVPVTAEAHVLRALSRFAPGALRTLARVVPS